MASDLDFSRHVPAPGEGENLPKAYKRNESVAVTQFPDLQGAISNYASSSNWMSALGSQVATTSANAIAQKIGGDLGKEPEGDIGIPLTNFDKVMQDSYSTQAQATLGLQANKLITQSNIEAAQASRITPDLIAKTNKNIAIGLQNIFKHAPSNIQPHLESQFGNAMLDQTETLTRRMIGEQKQDRQNNTALATKMNNEHAYSFGLNGNDKAALAAIESTKKLTQADVAARLMTPEQAKSHVDAAEISYLSGKASRGYEAARVEGKQAKYLTDLADGKIIKTDNPYYKDIANNLVTYVNQQNSLRSQNEQLLTSTLKTRMIQDVNSITPQDLIDYQKQVSPIQYEKTLSAYYQAKKQATSDDGEYLHLVNNWGDAETLVRSSTKQLNGTFDKLVANKVQNEGISRDDAEVQVALTAAKPIPVFIDSLNTKATSGNPVNIVSAAEQTQSLRELEGGHALIGLSAKAQAIITQFQHQRGSMPDADLARKITDNIINTSKDNQKIIDNIWSMELSKGRASGPRSSKSFADFALQTVGLSGRNLGGTYFNTIYGNDIYDQLKSNFDAAKGDFDTAKKMTQDYVDHHYGETRVNGDIQTTDSPIEKFLGYKDPHVTPYIQQDAVNQFTAAFEKNKDPNDYWETKPIDVHANHPKNKLLMLNPLSKYPPIELIRHVKTDKGVQSFTYPVHLLGRPGGTWDVVVQTPTGNHNIFLVAPHLGITTYKPNKDYIDKNYKASLHRGLF